MDAIILAAILTGAIAELLGGISTEFLSGSTLKIIQHFKKKTKDLNKEIEQVLPAVMEQLLKTHRDSQMLQLLDRIGRNAKLEITGDFFNQATKAYLFKIQWSQFALLDLYEQFCKQTGSRIAAYSWEAIQTD